MPLTELTKGNAGRAQLEIALINNMPDPALEATETQFRGLLERAAGDMNLRLRYFSLPEVVRGEQAQRRIADRYGTLRDLWSSDLDAVIVTGAEPRTSDLTQEVYWKSLTAIMDWAKTEVVSSVWSCLAAHAAVLHFDGIPRQPLAEKCCGVFAHDVAPHPLTRNLKVPQKTPHSRWNALPRPALEASGYQVLTHSPAAGVNLFVKDDRSLFVCWQGHPEYDELCLLKEYQRDMQRFLRKERATHPIMPSGCFSELATKQLKEFETRARAAPQGNLASEFPFEIASRGLENEWRASAVQFYRNWLQAILDARSRRAKPEARHAEPLRSPER
jgi:homoserine O-succinyltransferase/O-acetyltransferase